MTACKRSSISRGRSRSCRCRVFGAGVAVRVEDGLALLGVAQALLLPQGGLTFLQPLKIAVLVKPVGFEALLHPFALPVEMRLAPDQLDGAAGQAGAFRVELFQRPGFFFRNIEKRSYFSKRTICNDFQHPEITGFYIICAALVY